MPEIIQTLKADRHNIVDQLFEKIQTYKGESHTYYLILDVKNFLADNTVNVFVETDEQLKDLNGTFIKIFSLSLETNYGDYTKDRLYTIFDKKIDAFEAYITTPTKKEIVIQANDTRTLCTLLNKDQQTQFLKEVGSYEAETVLNEDWLTWTDYPEKRPQIDYYKSLKTGHERQIYATAIGQQIALNWLYRPLHELLTVYDIDCLNSFFKTVEFKLA